MVAFVNDPHKSRQPRRFQFLVRRLIVALLASATIMTVAFIITRLWSDLGQSRFFKMKVAALIGKPSRRSAEPMPAARNEASFAH